MSKSYNADSIQTLDYFEHIRQYPGMYIGSKDINGLHHCIKEIISNGIDEYLNGAGDTIIVKLKKDGGIYIKDNGRGIPHGKHSNGCSILQACFGIANTGGKFDNATGETGYNTSGGEHGTGGKAVNALSTKMVVSTSREGLKEIVTFSKGQFIDYKTEKIDESETGTEVLFYPDGEVLEATKPDSKVIEKMVREFSFLCTGLTFVFIDEYNEKINRYYSDRGLYDYINYLNEGKDFLINPIYFSEQDGKYQVEVAIGYNSSYSNQVRLYTNNIPQEKGTHLTGFKTAFTTTFNAFAREKKWIKEKEVNLTGTDLEEGQILIINFKMIDPVFKGQNKEELSSSEGRVYVQKLAAKALKEYFPIHEKEIKVIADKAINARKARNAAKKAREAVRGKAEKKAVLKLPSKLTDCFGKVRSECEIFVTEGDSAAGNMKLGRNNEFQAVLPIRGKILNCHKASLDKILANAEIRDMIKAFGLDLDVKTGKVAYDKDKLRYGKIIISADGDIDGAHIQSLFYTFIWNFCPQLIEDGFVYATIPPLYKVTEGKDTYKYLQDDAALDKYRASHKGKKYAVARFKGLGEMDAEELEEVLLDPNTRILKQITVEDYKKAQSLFDDLMGTAVTPRKKYIEEHSKEVEVNV